MASLETRATISFLLAGLAAIVLMAGLLEADSAVKQPSSTPTPGSPEINATLMESTFLISGPSAKPGELGKSRFGTCFVMLRRLKQGSNEGHYVLVTAKHVFEDIRGDTATVFLRKRNAVGDAVPFPFTLNIRSENKPLYASHPTADVVAIDVDLPSDSIVIERGVDVTSIDWLATDEFLKTLDIHPGDELLCLGFPLGLAANEAGYPILRGGKIASYPIVPLKKAKRILYDFQVQPGNSGGPVYFSYSGRIRTGYLPPFGVMMRYQKVIGLVTQKFDSVGNVDPFIGVIVPSVYIKETLDQLSGFEEQIKDDQ